MTLKTETGFCYPEFRPHRLLRSAHAQTIAGAWLYALKVETPTQGNQIEMADGDRIVLHDNCPANWSGGDRVALLIHGLGGCYRSQYMVRLTRKLNRVGIRAFRMDLRGCGAGVALARRPYHAGLTGDVAEAAEWIERRCPGSPTAVIGFSLGGNLTLKLFGESGDNLPGSIDRAVAVSPPTDLQACSARLQTPGGRRYDRHFARLLMKRLRQRQRETPQMAAHVFPRRPKYLRDVDDMFTAPLSGFSGADEYYDRCGAGRFLAGIRRPVLILTSKDDPVIDNRALLQTERSPSVTICLTNHGGHLGFIGTAGIDADRRWMDWRVLDWVCGEAR